MILLDTHAWLWWCADRKKIPSSTVRKLAREKELFVSAISAWEVCVLVKKGRLRLRDEPRVALRALIDAEGIRMIAVTDAIAVEAALLPETFHGDPADRLITATAIQFGATLVTKDTAIADTKMIRTTW